MRWRRRDREGGRPSKDQAVEHRPGYPIEGLFVAREAEVDDDVVEFGPGPAFAGVEAKWLSPIELSTLGELLGVGNADALADRMFEQGREASHGECGVWPVLDSIRDRLADADQLSDVAVRWAETDELKSWEPDDVRELLEGASVLARSARAEGRQLWIAWTL